MAAGSCYNPSFRECAVLCAATTDCPADSACAADGFCHAPETMGVDCNDPQIRIDSGPLDADGGVVGECLAPFLAVSIESLDQTGGRVLRFALGTDGSTTACSALTGRGTLPDQPLAMAWVPPNRLAVASRTATHLLDTTTDAVVWATPRDTAANPRDALILDQGVNRLVVGLFDTTTVDEIGPLEIYDLGTGTLLDTRSASGGVRSITRNPRDPTLYLQLKPGSYAAAEREPVSGLLRDNPPYLKQPSGGELLSIQALFGTPARLAWATQTPTGEAIFYFFDPDVGADNNVPFGPIQCDGGSGRKFLKAVPDPTLNTRFIALTELSGVTQIVKFKSSDNCDVMFSSSSLPAQSRISHLAVVEAPPP